jgi:hypothetical protein
MISKSLLFLIFSFLYVHLDSHRNFDIHIPPASCNIMIL